MWYITVNTFKSELSTTIHSSAAVSALLTVYRTVSQVDVHFQLQ